MKFGKLLKLVSVDNSAISVMRAKMCEKSLYLSFTKDRDLSNKEWLKQLENQDYTKRTRLLFSELRTKKKVLETFNAIKNSEGSLSESQRDCLLYWANYCHKSYCGQKVKNMTYPQVEDDF